MFFNQKMSEILNATKTILLTEEKVFKGTKNFNIFAPAYLFTTENINGYYDKLNMHKKKILTVIGSGDHVLNAILRGAKKIDAFDVSIYAILLYYLKEAAIKALSYEEFIEYFLKSDNINSRETFNKIKPYLSKNVLKFWEFVYDIIDQTKIFESRIFRCRPIQSEEYVTIANDLSKLSGYLNKNKYEKLKEKIEHCEVNCYLKDSKELHDISGMYDYMFFSNIIQYQDAEELTKFKQAMNDYKVKLQRNGEIKVGYIYAESYSDIKDEFKEYEITTVPTVDRSFYDDDFLLTLRRN